MTQLSPHFTLAEFTDSQTAARYNIPNIPPKSTIEKLRKTAEKLEQVRSALWDNPVIISSGYRSEALERALCGDAFLAWCSRNKTKATEVNWRKYFADKQHPKGEAVDFTCPRFGSPQKIIEALRLRPLGFDQLILEFGNWVHISFADKPRGHVLVIDHTGTHNF